MSTLLDSAARAERVGVSHKTTKPKDYGTGRTCTYEGCQTVLCRYSRGDRCWVHEPKRRERTRGS